MSAMERFRGAATTATFSVLDLPRFREAVVRYHASWGPSMRADFVFLRHPVTPNPYEAPGCQETKETPERIYGLCSALLGSGDVGVRYRVLTCFLSTDAEPTGLHHTRIEVLSPARWRLPSAGDGAVRPRNLSVPSCRPRHRGG
jgi:hypothetical protein